jgi:serine/threonine protein kinase
MDSSRWITVSDTPHDHEREALNWLRNRLPDREPYHVWTNFEFTTHSGQLYEVDALVISDNGVHLLELKAWSGQIAGDGGTWQWRNKEGRFRQVDNPRLLANRKAKALKSLIESSDAFNKHRSDVPYVAEAIFLSDQKLISELNPQGRFQVFGRDGGRDEPLPPERAALGGIVDYLVSLDPDASGRPRKRIQRSVVDRFVKAIDQIGIREQSSRRLVGDYQLGELLHDVESDPSTGIAYQDFRGTHRGAAAIERRVRVYPLERNATRDQRLAAQRAAKREFELLAKLDHSGIAKPLDFTESDRGPALIFDLDDTEVSLPEFLADPANATLSVEDRLAMLRDTSEAVAYAHGQGVFHRSISPASVLVRPPVIEGGSPRVRVANWHTGARVAEGSTSTIVTGTLHAHVEALAASDAELYRAPEFHQPASKPALLDVFSLGALAVFILTGKPPAASVRQLRAVLSHVGFLDPNNVADGVDDGLADVVCSATSADPAHRSRSVEDLMAHLDLAEEMWSLDDAEEVGPIDARRGDSLGNGRFEVVQRLGKGSTAIALLVTDAANRGRVCVLKVAEDPDHNNRILDEATALAGLDHTAIVSLLDDPLELSGHAAIVISYAGPKVDIDRPTDGRQARTLASRLGSQPVGAEFAQRWGEDLLDALRYLESVGRPHRDIKPDNLGVSPRGDRNELHLVLFDFSLSQAPLDRTEAGTPGYVDPFLVKRGRWDPAADRYAATVTLFQLTTAAKPEFGDGTADPAMTGAQPTVVASMFDPAVADGLVEFFTRALQPDAAARFDNADEMFFAWHRAFEEASAPSTPSNHPADDDAFVVPDDATVTSALSSLPLTKRAVSALEVADVVTVQNLLDLPLMTLSSLPGVGRVTRGEVVEAFHAINERFGNTGAQQPDDHEVSTGSDTESAADDSLASLAALVAPPPRTSDLATRSALARVLIGLDPELTPWASNSQLAEHLGISHATLRNLLDKLEQAWSKLARVTQLRDTIRHDLGHLQVASAQQLAGRLMSVAPDPVGEPTTMAIANGLVRIATLTEAARSEPGWLISRSGDAVLLAALPDGVSPERANESAVALAGYAARLGELTADLIAERDVVSRRELLDVLRSVERPSGATPLTDAHVADIAADLCDQAAVNSRLELYRVGLEPVAAIRAARRALPTAGSITADQIATKVAARFPEAAELPTGDELAAVLEVAGADLVWSPSDAAFVAPSASTEASTAQSASVSRYPTAVPPRRPIPIEDVDIAAEFEHRLEAARSSGSLLVLMTGRPNLLGAADQAARLAAVTIDVDAWLTEQLDAVTAGGKPSWALLAKADAEGPSGAQWSNVRKVIDTALTQLTAELARHEGAVLLTNVGLLARFDRLDIVATWRDLLHQGATGLTAIWIVVPSTGASEMPMLDGREVPVLPGGAEWSRIPDDWIRNAHRTGAA